MPWPTHLGQEFFTKLKEKSIEIFTRVKKNMKAKIMNMAQEFYLSKRGLIETVIDQLKHCCQIEHTRHRKPANAFVNLIAGLIAYSLKKRKPSINSSKLSSQTLSLISN
jgi:Transposase DDE domain